jgi:hypothetical protein
MIPRLRILSPAVVALAGVLAVPAAAGAQALGIHGGVTVSKYDFKTPAPATSNLTGGSAGLFVLLGEGTFGGVVEANWIRRGSKLSGGTEVRVDYIEFPVAARIEFGAGQDLSLHVLGGGTFAFKIRESQSGPPFFEIPEDDIDGFDHGIIAGGGLEYRQFIANARYTWGTRDISDRPIEAYNRGWSFMVGFKIID